MAKKTAKTSPFRKGRKVSRKSNFLSIGDGESITFAPLIGLDELISADMHEYWDIRPAIFHPCIGKNCPGCELGVDPRFKAYMPVVTREGDVAIYPFTISVYNQLEMIEDELEESLAGHVVKVRRQGTGFSTTYMVSGIGKTVNIEGIEHPEFLSALGPTTAEEIWAMIDETDAVKVYGGTPREEASSADEVDDDDSDDDSDDDDWGDV